MQEIKLKDEERTRCEIWSRVMGYHRPVDQWNPGKQSEHRERQHFVEAKGDRSFLDADGGMSSDVPGHHSDSGVFHDSARFDGLVI